MLCNMTDKEDKRLRNWDNILRCILCRHLNYWGDNWCRQDCWDKFCIADCQGRRIQIDRLCKQLNWCNWNSHQSILFNSYHWLIDILKNKLYSFYYCYRNSWHILDRNREYSPDLESEPLDCKELYKFYMTRLKNSWCRGQDMRNIEYWLKKRCYQGCIPFCKKSKHCQLNKFSNYQQNSSGRCQTEREDFHCTIHIRCHWHSCYSWQYCKGHMKIWLCLENTQCYILDIVPKLSMNMSDNCLYRIFFHRKYPREHNWWHRLGRLSWRKQHRKVFRSYLRTCRCLGYSWWHRLSRCLAIRISGSLKLSIDLNCRDCWLYPRCIQLNSPDKSIDCLNYHKLSSGWLRKDSKFLQQARNQVHRHRRSCLLSRKCSQMSCKSSR